MKRVDALLRWEDGQARLVIDLDLYVDDGERLASYLESLSSAYLDWLERSARVGLRRALLEHPRNVAAYRKRLSRCPAKAGDG